MIQVACFSSGFWSPARFSGACVPGACAAGAAATGADSCPGAGKPPPAAVRNNTNATHRAARENLSRFFKDIGDSRHDDNVNNNKDTGLANSAAPVAGGGSGRHARGQ